MMYKALCLFLILNLALLSCVKHENIYQPQGSTAELNVPEGFDWLSTRAVTLPVNSPVQTVASFFLDEECTAGSQIATLCVPAGLANFKFDIPNDNNTIYVQYPLEGGGVKTLKSVINDARTKAMEGGAAVMAFEQPQFSGVGAFQFINIPNNGNKYGTLMFEDTWPETGDYDFNDFVVNYKIIPTYILSGTESDDGEKKQGNDIIIKVSLKFRALGGNLPYDFAIQIGKSSTGYSDINVSHLGDVVFKESTGNLTVEKLEGTEFPAVIIKGFHSLRSSGFYNTVTKKDEGVSISFDVHLKGTLSEQQLRIMNGGLTNSMAFDYFLIDESTHKEIHSIGFAPTSLYTAYSTDNTAGGKYYYENDKHLVWSLKVPKEIGWAAEKQDIMTVYPEFETWVKKGGYAIGLNGYDPLQWYNKHTEDNYIQP